MPFDERAAPLVGPEDRVVGIDISGDMLRMARQTARGPGAHDRRPS